LPVFSKRLIYFEILFTWIFAPALMCPFAFNSGFQWVGPADETEILRKKIKNLRLKLKFREQTKYF